MAPAEEKWAATGVYQAAAGGMSKRMENLSKEELLQKIDRSNLPGHIAVIMDGNGRWAKERGLSRQTGHRHGAEALRKVLLQGEELGLSAMTAYAFSTENWKRSRQEVGFLMDLMLEYLLKEIKTLHRRQVRVILLGDKQQLPPHIAREFQKAEAMTAQNTRLTLNLAINYGGRREITQAVQAIAEQVAAGRLKPAEIDEETISAHLYTAGQPDPDLIIRPSGELRISNYLLWQMAYSELYFTPVLWPDFDGLELLKAVYSYQSRQRRFGGRQG